MRLYIAGPMFGYPDNNRAAFYDAQAELQSVGFETVNPVDLGVNMGPDDAVGGEKWIRCLTADLKGLLECTGVAVLEGWEMSRGARVEFNLAREMYMPVQAVHIWVAANLENILDSGPI